MLIRIVRMTFKPEEVENFLLFLENYKSQIRNFPGCTHLEILQDIDAPHIISTYSHWESPEALESYRISDLFTFVWGNTKIHFAAKPVAFSVKRLAVVD